MTTTTTGGKGLMAWPRFLEGERPPYAGRCQPSDVICLDGSRIAAARLEEFFTAEASRVLCDHLVHRLTYERDEIDDQKRANRAAPPATCPARP